MAVWFNALVLKFGGPGSVQGLHAVTSVICFSVVPSSNPRLPSASWDFELKLKYVYWKYLFPLFQWHACKLS